MVGTTQQTRMYTSYSIVHHENSGIRKRKHYTHATWDDKNIVPHQHHHQQHHHYFFNFSLTR